ncbi:MAG: nicotinate phosphoribosyltransferase [Myxococcales bacterium]|nr:nicotinate phosphoribosyltransferase [Myxococcales bacterium]
MLPATHLDLYQLTSLVSHFDAGRTHLPVTMSFFTRRLPRDDAGRPTRGFLLWVGLRRCLEWLGAAAFDEARLDTLAAHPMLGPALRARPELRKALHTWRFEGAIDAPPEGTPLWAGPAVDGAGKPIDVHGVRPSAQTPFLVVQTDLLGAKLIETPLLSIINHMTMVASKAAQVVAAAGTRPVLEFGTRRTHPDAAVDAAYAAYVGGCAGTSNVEAHHRHGVPVLGTMDHFAIQAWERPGVPRHETEAAFFAAFHAAFPQSSTLLVDTYDAYGPLTGIPAAVKATGGKLRGIRLDSQISPENIRRARAMLDELGAPQAQIVVSGGMDEHSIAALGDAPVDAFGVGERIVTSPDAPVGVGAVGKLCEVDGRPTMKLSRGSGKATLPGRVQVFRHEGVDTVARADETLPGEPLLRPVWRDGAPLEQPDLKDVRAFAAAAIAALPAACHLPRLVDVPVSPALAALIRQQVEEAES